MKQIPVILFFLRTPTSAAGCRGAVRGLTGMIPIPALLGEDTSSNLCISAVGTPTCCALLPRGWLQHRMGLKVGILGVVPSQRFAGSRSVGVVLSGENLQLAGPQCHHLHQCGPVGIQQARSLQGFQPFLPHPWITALRHMPGPAADSGGSDGIADGDAGAFWGLGRKGSLAVTLRSFCIPMAASCCVFPLGNQEAAHGNRGPAAQGCRQLCQAQNSGHASPAPVL